MMSPRASLTVPLAIVLLGPGTADAQDRALLHSKQPSDALKEICRRACDLKAEKIPYEKLSRTTDYFVRVAPRRFVVTDGNAIQDNAILSTKPIAFLTTPESLVGRTLMDIYQDIGYEAEDIIRWQRDQDMVAIVFRYPAEITVSDERDGRLPDAWSRRVYVPTWDNLFAIFERLADQATIEPAKQGEFAPERTFFRSPAERSFVLGFPAEGKHRIRTASYAELRATGGADWVYRNLLENKLSVFEHFLGSGRTHNEVIDPLVLRPEAGLFEFVGPNWKVKDLPEVAIIHLGRLAFTETYGTESASSARGN